MVGLQRQRTLEEIDYLDLFQSDFRFGHSIERQLIAFINDLYSRNCVYLHEGKLIQVQTLQDSVAIDLRVTRIQGIFVFLTRLCNPRKTCCTNWGSSWNYDS